MYPNSPSWQILLRVISPTSTAPWFISPSFICRTRSSPVYTRKSQQISHGPCMTRFCSTWAHNTLRRKSRVNPSPHHPDEQDRSSNLTDGRFGAMMNVSLTNEVTLAHGLRPFLHHLMWRGTIGSRYLHPRLTEIRIRGAANFHAGTGTIERKAG